MSTEKTNLVTDLMNEENTRKQKWRKKHTRGHSERAPPERRPEPHTAPDRIMIDENETVDARKVRDAPGGEEIGGSGPGAWRTADERAPAGGAGQGTKAG